MSNVLLYGSPPYSFEIESLNEPRACNFPCGLAGQQSPGILLFLPMHSARVIGAHEHVQLFMWVLVSELGSSCLLSKDSYPLSHLPSHSLLLLRKLTFQDRPKVT